MKKLSYLATNVRGEIFGVFGSFQEAEDSVPAPDYIWKVDNYAGEDLSLLRKKGRAQIVGEYSYN